MISSRDDFLMTLLNCGKSGLKLIDNAGYEWSDVLGLTTGQELTNCKLRKRDGAQYIAGLLVEYGASQIWSAKESRVHELKTISNKRELNGAETKELNALLKLDPIEDIVSCYSSFGVIVWFNENGEIYHKYLGEALASFEKGTGFKIEN